MDAIRWQGNSLALLDQTRLPVEEVWNTYTDYRKVADAIRRLVVRGAPAIGVAAGFGLYLENRTDGTGAIITATLPVIHKEETQHAEGSGR